MKVKGWEVVLRWEDGEINEVGNYIPVQLAQAIQEFVEYWEQKYGDDEDEEGEEE